MSEIDITSVRMPKELQTKLERLSPMCRRYAEFRAQGLSQPDCARKAGSEAKDRETLGKAGWNMEQKEGIKDYILWLEHKRARSTTIDNVSLISKLLDTYEMAMVDGKYNDANKSLELLGNMSGAFANKAVPKSAHKDNDDEGKPKTKNATHAFTDDVEEIETDVRLKKLSAMLADAKSK